MKNEVSTTHKLDFKCRPWHFDDGYVNFRVGTCGGLYRCDGNVFRILAIDNKEPGNGHFEDVLQWFEHSCKRDGYSLQFMEIMNPRFKKHLIEKRGFADIGNNGVQKTF